MSQSENTETLRDRWHDYLRDNGLNTTHQRDAILEQFLVTPGHVSVDELLARVRKKHSAIGYATVYRTLKLFVDSGIAVSRQFGDGQTRFELEGEHHDHIICISCGKIVEFEDDEIERLQDRIAKRHGFTLTRHRHELYGRCQPCEEAS